MITTGLVIAPYSSTTQKRVLLPRAGRSAQINSINSCYYYDMKYVTETYNQELINLAELLVTPERYQTLQAAAQLAIEAA